MIKFADPSKEAEALADILTADFKKFVIGGVYMFGEFVSAFEEAFSNCLDGGATIACANGTDALEMSLVACGVRPGDKVLVPCLTASPTICAVVNVGAVPVFCDVDDYGLLDLDSCNSIHVEIRAIIAVHLYGNRVDIKKLRDQVGADVTIIEDCAQVGPSRTGGREIGQYSNCACFSFFPTKCLSALGDGGAIYTRDLSLLDHFKKLRQYGWNEKRLCVRSGRNSRLDELQALILLRKIDHFEKWRLAKQRIAEIYYQSITCNCEFVVNRECNIDYHLFVIKLNECVGRESFLNYLKNNGVSCGIHYSTLCSDMPAFKDLPKISDLSRGSRLADKCVSLPMHIGVSNMDAQLVCDLVNQFSEEEYNKS